VRADCEGEEVEPLEHEAEVLAPEPGASSFRGPEDGGAAQFDRALGGRVEAGDEVEERGLAAAARAGDADDLARLEVEGHVVERADTLVCPPREPRGRTAVDVRQPGTPDDDRALRLVGSGPCRLLPSDHYPRRCNQGL